MPDQTTLTSTEILQGLTTARCINRHRPEQLTQLARATIIKNTIGAPGQSGNFSKTPCCIRFITLLEDKGRNAQQPQLTRLIAERINRFFQAIADQHQGIQALTSGFLNSMFKNATNLRQTTPALHRCHTTLEFSGIGQPWFNLKLTITPIPNQLQSQSTDFCSRSKHITL